VGDSRRFGPAVTSIGIIAGRVPCAGTLICIHAGRVSVVFNHAGRVPCVTSARTGMTKMRKARAFRNKLMSLRQAPFKCELKGYDWYFLWKTI